MEIADRLAVHGLLMRGGFNFGDRDDAPPALVGQPARSVVLVGQAGTSAWPHFSKWRAAQPDDLVDPLDTWSRIVIGEVADACGGRAVSPSDKPYMPFQQWAMRAEGLRPSTLGILMHPEYGLWHAYRGAILFCETIEFPQPEMPIHLCDTCVDRPCLDACPVDAYSQVAFAYGDCVAHVRSAAGVACRTMGCRDRNACPYGTAYRYPADVQAYHMAYFIR